MTETRKTYTCTFESTYDNALHDWEFEYHDYAPSEIRSVIDRAREVYKKNRTFICVKWAIPLTPEIVKDLKMLDFEMSSGNSMMYKTYSNYPIAILISEKRKPRELAQEKAKNEPEPDYDCENCEISHKPEAEDCSVLGTRFSTLPPGFTGLTCEGETNDRE